MRISIIITARNEATHLQRTLENFRTTLPKGSEIVVVDDGSEDGCSDFLRSEGNGVRLVRTPGVGIAKARNCGARNCSGDLLVFADAHVAMPPGWWQPMAELAARAQTGAVGPAISDMEHPRRVGFGQRFRGADLYVNWLPCQGRRPYHVPLLPGGFWAMRKEVLGRAGGFDEGMICWGLEDTEMSVRLWLLGYELWLVPTLDVAHLFREFHSYRVEWRWLLGNRLRLAMAHFSSARVVQVLKALQYAPEFLPAFAAALRGDSHVRRRHWQEQCRYDDTWYFDRFPCDLWEAGEPRAATLPPCHS